MTSIAPAAAFSCDPNCSGLKDQNNQPDFVQFFYMPSGGYDSSIELVFSSYEVLNSGDNWEHSIFDMWVLVNPDPNHGIYNYWSSGPDSSFNGNYSTIENRVWSINRTHYSSCASSPYNVGGVCDQENYFPLEQGNISYPYGTNSTYSFGATFPSGVSVGLSYTAGDGGSYLNEPGGVDRWSRYYNYTLTDWRDLYQSQLSQEFIFSQVQPYNYSENSLHWVGIGYSLIARFQAWIGFPIYEWVPFNPIQSGNWFEGYYYDNGVNP